MIHVGVIYIPKNSEPVGEPYSSEYGVPTTAATAATRVAERWPTCGMAARVLEK